MSISYREEIILRRAAAGGVPQDVPDKLSRMLKRAARPPAEVDYSIGTCGTCEKEFQRKYPHQRKCRLCWESHKFKCSECQQVYVRRYEEKACSTCLPKLTTQFQVSAAKTDELLSKLGLSASRASTLDVGRVGSSSSNHQFMTGGYTDRRGARGDDENDRAWESDQQAAVEFGGQLNAIDSVGFRGSRDPEVSTPDLGEDWSEHPPQPPPAPQRDNSADLIQQFLSLPVGILESKTGWHRQKIQRMRDRLRSSPAYVAAGTKQAIVKIMREPQSVTENAV